MATGVSRLPPSARDRHSHFFAAAQQSDGGFAGRMGPSDLYYTSFGLRGLAILGELHGEAANRAAAYLRSNRDTWESPIDLISLVLGAATVETSAGVEVFGRATDSWHATVAEQLNNLRREDGGYAKGPRGNAGSTYYTFLALVCLQLINRPVPDPEAAVRFILSQQAELSGFREIRVNKRAGTNPTAAAVSVLRMLGAIDDQTRQRTINFLATMQNSEGGFLANDRIPIADVLSTFTGLMTLADINSLDAVNRQSALRFIRSLESSDGGFHAAAWDTEHDVEYTFYGLGCLALLAP